jgi:branched-chain amino acid transport system substrate-binding protein
MPKKIFWIIIGVVVIILLVILSSSSHITKRTSAIKMGVIIPMTGDYALIGDELKKGVDLAVSQLLAQGIDITTIYADDRFDPKEAVSAANKLISIDKVDFTVLFSVEEARPVVSVFNNAKIPLVVLWDSNSFLKDAGPFVFSNGFSTEKGGKQMADFAFNSLKLRNVAVVSHVDAWSDIISKAFKSQFEKDGGKIVYDDSVQVGTTDFRLIISKMKAANPDGVYAPLIPFDSVSFIKQASQSGLNMPLMSGDALIQDAIDGSGKASEGIYFTNAYSESQELPALYKQTYNKDLYALVYVASGYDGVLKLGKALDSPTDILTSLNSLFGPTRSADRIEKIFEVKSGVPVEVMASSTILSN